MISKKIFQYFDVQLWVIYENIMFVKVAKIFYDKIATYLKVYHKIS